MIINYFNMILACPYTVNLAFARRYIIKTDYQMTDWCTINHPWSILRLSDNHLLCIIEGCYYSTN
jgi:hypothetical protein